MYIRTFSCREILSALFSSLMICSLFVFFKVFEIGFTSSFLNAIAINIIFLISITISHRLYLLEHKRRNFFFGRILQDLMIAAFLTLYSFLGVLLVSESLDLFLFLVIIILFFTFFSELIISSISLILKLFKWQIW